jgi:hypothetical protein
MATRDKAGKKPANFGSISQTDLPSGRRGKHHIMLVQVLEDLQQLSDDRAIKVPIADFPGTLADLRSAISRATRKRKIEVATSSDDDFLYVWKVGTKPRDRTP